MGDPSATPGAKAGAGGVSGARCMSVKSAQMALSPIWMVACVDRRPDLGWPLANDSLERACNHLCYTCPLPSVQMGIPPPSTVYISSDRLPGPELLAPPRTVGLAVSLGRPSCCHGIDASVILCVQITAVLTSSNRRSAAKVGISARSVHVCSMLQYVAM